MRGCLRCGLHKSAQPGNGKRAGRIGFTCRTGRHHLHPCERWLTGVPALSHQNSGRPSTGCLGVPKHGRAVQLWPSGPMCQKDGWLHHAPITTTGTGFRIRVRLTRTRPARHSSTPIQSPLNGHSFVARTKARLPSVILDILIKHRVSFLLSVAVVAAPSHRASLSHPPREGRDGGSSAQAHAAKPFALSTQKFDA